MIRAEVPEWGGCEAELEAVAEELAEYNRVWGEKGSEGNGGE